MPTSFAETEFGCVVFGDDWLQEVSRWRETGKTHSIGMSDETKKNSVSSPRFELSVFFPLCQHCKKTCKPQNDFHSIMNIFIQTTRSIIHETSPLFSSPSPSTLQTPAILPYSSRWPPARLYVFPRFFNVKSPHRTKEAAPPSPHLACPTIL